MDVTITDQAPAGQGVDTVNKPRIYFRRSNSDTPANIEAWDINRYYEGVLQSGDGENGVWQFTIEGNGGAFYSDLADNDIIEYFVVVQDLATSTPNVWYSKFADTTPEFSNVSTVVSWPDATVDVNFYGIGGNLKGLYTIGSSPGDDFTTITGSRGFFQNLNALNVTGDIVAVVKEDITEPATYGCGEWTETGSGGYYVTISTGDATLKTLTTSASNHLIRLEGVDRLIIDGSVNGAGKYLKFEQTNTDYSTITFSNDATYNQVRNIIISGAPTLKPIGIVHFGEAVSSGNSNNTISGNFIWNLSANMPDNAIYSRGNTDNSAPNANNTISGNDIKNFALTGVWVTETGNGSGWTISDNTLYNDFSIKPDKEQSGIRIEQADGHTISGNWIGGNTATIPTASWENTGRNDFYGIYLNVGTASATNVSNNNIHDIHLSNTAGSPNEFRGIYADAGLINITGNNIFNIITDGADYTRVIYLTGTSGISVSNNSIYNITKNGNGDFRTFYLNVTGATEPDLTANQFQNNIIKALNINSSNTGDDFYAVQIDNGNFNISGNFIGGSNAGDKITFGGGNDFRVFNISGDDFNLGFTNNRIENIEITGNDVFRGLYINNADDNVDISIQNNTIDNLNLNCSSEVSMMYIADGKVNLSSNTIGSTTYGISNTGTGIMTGLYLTPYDNNFVVSGNSISNLNNTANIRAIYQDENRPYQINNNTISNINTANDISFTGIEIAAANNASVDANKIENISMSGTGSSFIGIWVSAATALSIGTNTANIIGSTATANSISIAGTNVKAIALTGDAVVNASNNIIANISSTSTGANAFIKGIEIDGAGTKTVSGNTIRAITTTSTKTDITDGVLASQGIWVGGSSSSTITANTCYNINSSSTANVNVSGIVENNPNALFTKNLIYSIKNNASGASRTASGFVLNQLSAGYIANNFVLLGENDDTEYSGIWLPYDNADTKNIYYNSIYIGGSASGGNSYALLRGNNTTPLDAKNNIFSNFRTGSGKHYSIANLNTANWSSTYTDHNNYYAATSTTTGLWGSTDVDFTTWTNNTAGDTLSFDNLPQFIDPANNNLHLDPANSCAFNSIGTPIAAVSDDYDGTSRDASHPDVGAHEFSPTGGNGNDIWRGWVSNDWDNAANWQCEMLPANTSNLFIPDKVTNDPVINRALPATEVTVNDLTVETGALLTVNPGNKITLTGNLVVNGTLTLESPSDNNANASLIDNGNISGTGSIHVRRYMSGGVYHYVSSPIQAGGNANSDLFTANPAGYFNANFYAFDETMDLDGDPATNPAEPFQADSLKKSWYFAHNGQGAAAVPINITQGYATYDWANRTITFIGLTNTGTMDITGLSYTNNDPQSSASLPDFYDGWQLVGNPYPSTIDWDAISASGLSNVDNGIYVWDQTQYAGYQNGISVGSGTQDNNIAPMQGFFVHTTAANASIAINNSHRTHGVPTFKNAIVHDNLIKLKVSANGFDDYLAVYFKADAKTGFDGKYDLLRMFSYDNNVPHFYALESEAQTPLLLDGLPDTLLNKDLIIPLGIKTVNGGQHIISLVEFNAFNTTHVYLEDKENNTIINLRTTKTYEFNHPGGDLTGRFYLKFSKNNKPQLANAFGKQYAQEDANFVFSFAANVFTDIDLGDSITYIAKLPDGSPLPAWLAFNRNTRSFTGIPGNDEVGIITIQIRAIDLMGAVGTYDFELEIQNVNDPPYVTGKIADLEVLQNEQIQIAVPENIFADIDKGDKLTLSAKLADGSMLPAWLKFDAANNTFTGTAEEAGAFEINVIATDQAGESTETGFKLTITAVTGIETIITGSDLSIYPNPSQGEFYIDFINNKKIKAEIRIKDIAGKVIYTDMLNENKKFIDLKGIAPGTYFLEIKDNEIKIVKPIIIR
ncbi:MAG: putative Ig domain-containing protein [Bacteroidales bacterium]|nr:putative Ig domain-containing protein [Bacteroidales bacterium]